jgi:hypothetical protein
MMSTGDFTATLPVDWPSRNKLDKMHWAARGRLRKDYSEMLMLMGLCRQHSTFTGRAKLVLTRVLGRGQRLFDEDNLAGGAKQMIDAMVRCGWFKDDSPTYLSVEFKQVSGRRQSGPAVEVALAHEQDVA